MPKMSARKNAVTVEQLRLACRHVEELIAAGVTENFAVRTLELFADVYAKCHMGGKGQTSPHHVNQVSLWSVEATKLLAANPTAKPREHFRVEHGTPRRGFARLVLRLYQQGEMSESSLNALVRRHWMLAVITLEEDQKLNKGLRSQMFDAPVDRWRAAGIEFPLNTDVSRR